MSLIQRDKIDLCGEPLPAHEGLFSRAAAIVCSRSSQLLFGFLALRAAGVLSENFDFIFALSTLLVSRMAPLNYMRPDISKEDIKTNCIVKKPPEPRTEDVFFTDEVISSKKKLARDFLIMSAVCVAIPLIRPITPMAPLIEIITMSPYIVAGASSLYQAKKLENGEWHIDKKPPLKKREKKRVSVKHPALAEHYYFKTKNAAQPRLG